MTLPWSETAVPGSTPEAKLVFDGDFSGLGDNSESYVLLTGIANMAAEQVVEVLQTTYQKLRSGGQVTFYVFDFGAAVRAYIDGGLTTNLMICLSHGGHGRRSFWDELSIARVLFDMGYYKVWTGREPDRPDLELSVKALKRDP